jgi:hypothetical protein
MDDLSTLGTGTDRRASIYLYRFDTINVLHKVYECRKSGDFTPNLHV